MTDDETTRFGIRDGRRGVRFVSAAVLLALVVALVGVALGAGGAVAGDNAAVLEFEPDELSVDPGDTVEMDVTLRSHGFAGQGVGSIELQIDYPSEHLTVTHVEPNNWFEDAPDGDQIGEGQSDTTVRERTVFADENGAALFEQSLVNPEFGVIGTATVATVTVEVSEDADAATARLTTDRTGVYPTRSQYSQPTPTMWADLHIAGGGDSVEPAFVEDPFADTNSTESDDDGSDGDDGSNADDEGDADNGGDDGDGGTGADDGGDAGSEAGADPESSGDDADDDVPAPLGAVVLGVLLAAVGLRRRAQR